eukprot:TRINITY_DN45493_c0_g1_i2.p1 TRINITY_DN45493_c0_g1~~TRINITY_DN45493_c0_g1_i2.p1  ORF type:complete len:677 (+),score=151.07 TRINITY_DN45493_c0_g1_i2:191-2221(+)
MMSGEPRSAVKRPAPVSKESIRLTEETSSDGSAAEGKLAALRAELMRRSTGSDGGEDDEGNEWSVPPLPPRVVAALFGARGAGDAGALPLEALKAADLSDSASPSMETEVSSIRSAKLVSTVQRLPNGQQEPDPRVLGPAVVQAVAQAVDVQRALKADALEAVAASIATATTGQAEWKAALASEVSDLEAALRRSFEGDLRRLRGEVNAELARALKDMQQESTQQMAAAVEQMRAMESTVATSVTIAVEEFSQLSSKMSSSLEKLEADVRRLDALEEQLRGKVPDRVAFLEGPSEAHEPQLSAAASVETRLSPSQSAATLRLRHASPGVAFEGIGLPGLPLGPTRSMSLPPMSRWQEEQRRSMPTIVRAAEDLEHVASLAGRSDAAWRVASLPGNVLHRQLSPPRGLRPFAAVAATTPSRSTPLQLMSPSASASTLMPPSMQEASPPPAPLPPIPLSPQSPLNPRQPQPRPVVPIGFVSGATTRVSSPGISRKESPRISSLRGSDGQPALTGQLAVLTKAAAVAVAAAAAAAVSPVGAQAARSRALSPPPAALLGGSAVTATPAASRRSGSAVASAPLASPLGSQVAAPPGVVAAALQRWPAAGPQLQASPLPTRGSVLRSPSSSMPLSASVPAPSALQRSGSPSAPWQAAAMRGRQVNAGLGDVWAAQAHQRSWR